MPHGSNRKRNVDGGTTERPVDVDAGEGSRDQAGENVISAWPWYVLAHDDDGVGAGKIKYDFVVWMSNLKWSNSTTQYSCLYKLTNAFGPSHIYPSYDLAHAQN
ncbi:hypothetical protein LTS18_007125 [Coniosporium uncinatum]|uniref:Uncharacterized protein n=1 Tax=Coniosporium uncinatum TaxID=93489 RepID=A0ACC3DPY7_9PEZI|nr:hypothetical protein LTS18_007125 [Coniosporium uncinatum]